MEGKSRDQARDGIFVTDELLRQTAASDADTVATFVVAARRYSEARPKPVWLAGLATDEQLLNFLVAELQKDAAPAPRVDALGGGLGAILDRVAMAGANIKNVDPAPNVGGRCGSVSAAQLPDHWP